MDIQTETAPKGWKVADTSTESVKAPRYTKADIPAEDSSTIETESGLIVTVRVLPDEGAGPPWEREDEHGPVSEWTRRKKAPGEMVLAADHGSSRFYDFPEAVKIARADGWGADGATVGERAHNAALADYERLRQWCNDQWRYIGVVVEARKPDGAVWASDSLWGIESDGDYWREVAADMVNDCTSI